MSESEIEDLAEAITQEIFSLPPSVYGDVVCKRIAFMGGSKGRESDLGGLAREPFKRVVTRAITEWSSNQGVQS